MKIGAKILNPCIKELKQYFENLTCYKIKARKRGQPIVAYEFSFDKENTNNTSSAQYEQPNNDILEEQISLNEVQNQEPKYKDTKFWGLLDRLNISERCI
ncbi:hypothetical protein JYG23_01865 [Sedimentibacter sp. zth1]|uniref:hypothetical protein n=1 Tax=Sedimentibacter sp. zth1 TaxID=2816908 RepID=UPI001A91D497|nr:hypothetical protein JYG23_01865 [Sedimentibacter sp. zth1]